MLIRMCLALAMLPLAACGGKAKGGIEVSVPFPVAPPITPATEPLVINSEDWFTMIGVGAAIDGPRDYAWGCTTSQASLDLGSSTLFGSGSFRLQILDADGALVHDNTYTTGLLDGRIDAVTAPGGRPGVWTLRFTFMSFVLDGSLDIMDDSGFGVDEIRIGSGYVQNSGELTYQVSWPAGQTTLDLGWTMDSGSVRIRIWDGANVLVFDTTYTAPLPISMNTLPKTAPGVSGVWTVTISFTNVVDGLSIEVPF